MRRDPGRRAGRTRPRAHELADLAVSARDALELRLVADTGWSSEGGAGTRVLVFADAPRVVLVELTRRRGGGDVAADVLLRPVPDVPVVVVVRRARLTPADVDRAGRAVFTGVPPGAFSLQFDGWAADPVAVATSWVAL